MAAGIAAMISTRTLVRDSSFRPCCGCSRQPVCGLFHDLPTTAPIYGVALVVGETLPAVVRHDVAPQSRDCCEKSQTIGTSRACHPSTNLPVRGAWGSRRNTTPATKQYVDPPTIPNQSAQLPTIQPPARHTRSRGACGGASRSAA